MPDPVSWGWGDALQACHSHVNAVFSQMDRDDPNPFEPGSHEVA
jgi:hypothetical protein